VRMSPLFRHLLLVNSSATETGRGGDSSAGDAGRGGDVNIDGDLIVADSSQPYSVHLVTLADFSDRINAGETATCRRCLASMGLSFYLFVWDTSSLS
jgi:hypothetical protein